MDRAELGKKENSCPWQGPPLHVTQPRRSIAPSAELANTLGTFYHILDLAPEAIMLSNDRGEIVMVNAKMERLSGYRKEELEGQKIEVLVPERVRGAHQAHRERFYGERRSRAMGEARGLSTVRKDGTEVPVEVSIGPVSESGLHFCVVVDISERRLAEEVYERLAAVVEASDDAIIGKTLDGTITSWNHGAEKMFGYSSTEVLGKPIQMLLPLERVNEESDILARIRNGETVKHFETVRVRKDGKRIDISVTISPIRDRHGAIVGASKTARDITERRKMLAEMEKTRLQLISSDRLSAIGLMASGIAHEINNPLGIIHASVSDLLELCEEGEVSRPVVSQACSRILRTTKRIAKIVASMRTAAREGRTDPFHQAMVSQVVEQSLELCRERFRVHGVGLIVPVVDDTVQISCRETQIAQVLLNLLQNAFDAVVAGMGKKWVEVEVLANGPEVSISVIDSGPGVPTELVGRVMEPFFTTKPVGQGTGLGLSLSKTIAQEHGGRLTLDEKQGHTCFSLILPISQRDTTDATE